MLNIADIDIKFTFGSLKIKLNSINYGVFYEPFLRHRHGKRYYESHLVCGGSGAVVVEGTKYPLKKNTVYMLGPELYHEHLTDPKDPMYDYCLQFEIAGENKHCKNELSDLVKNTVFWLGEDTQGMSQLYEALDRESAKQEIGYTESVINFTSQLLISLARNYAGGSQSSSYTHSMPDSRRMVIIDNSFLYNYATITLEQLSQRLNLSYRQTQRFLDKYYGKSFIQLRTEYRLNKAEELIKNGATPSEAAIAVGYERPRSLKRKPEKKPEK